jgi:hypothetical protein
MDLVATATIKAEEIRQEQLLVQQREYEVKKARTLELCEQLGERLERLANAGKTPKISFECDRWYQPLKPTHSDYSDQRLSYRVDGKCFDIDILTEWFNSYCFAVTTEDFPHYRYSWGHCHGYTITIAPQPACLK